MAGYPGATFVFDTNNATFDGGRKLAQGFPSPDQLAFFDQWFVIWGQSLRTPAGGRVPPSQEARYRLPNGETYDNPEEALYYLNKYLEAVIAPQASGDAAEPPSVELASEDDGEDEAPSSPSLLLSEAKLQQTQEMMDMLPAEQFDPMLISALQIALKQRAEDEMAAITVILH